MRRRVWTVIAMALICLFSISSMPPSVLGITPETLLQLHSPIHIDGNDEFTPANGVVSGTGTASDPYLIQGWEFNISLAQQLQFPRAILDVWNTTVYFAIQGVRFLGGDTGWPPTWAVGFSNVTNGQLSNSLFSITYSGAIGIGKSANIIIQGNGFSTDNVGIGVSSSANMTIRGNSFVAIGYGVSLRSTSGVLVYHNNFWGAQGHDDNLIPSRWDNGYPSGGNYWSRFSFPDKCSGPQQTDCSGPDGIADQPHFVDDCCDTGVDNYPLIKPYSLAPDNVKPDTFCTAGHAVNFTDVSMSGLTVHWPTACDNVGVVAFRVYLAHDLKQNRFGAQCCTGGTLVASVSANSTSYSITGISAETHYYIYVDAGDAAGNWATVGYNDATTLSVWQQYWYLIAAGVSFGLAAILIEERTRKRKAGPNAKKIEQLERLRE